MSRSPAKTDFIRCIVHFDKWKTFHGNWTLNFAMSTVISPAASEGRQAWIKIQFWPLINIRNRILSGSRSRLNIRGGQDQDFHKWTSEEKDMIWIFSFFLSLYLWRHGDLQKYGHTRILRSGAGWCCIRLWYSYDLDFLSVFVPLYINTRTFKDFVQAVLHLPLIAFKSNL